MPPPGPSTTTVNPARLARARGWSAYNFAPTRPIPLDFYQAGGPTQRITKPAGEPDADQAARLAELLRGLPQIPTDQQAAAGARAPQEPSRGRYIALKAQTPAGGRDAASEGPLPYPWRLDSVHIGIDTNNNADGFALTATPDDATFSTRTPDGSPLVVGRDAEEAILLPPYLGIFRDGGPFQCNGPTTIIPAGYFLTLWATSSAVGTVICLAHISEFPTLESGAPLDNAPLMYLRLRIPRTTRPPAVRTPTPQPPAAMRVTSLGFSRIIPWEFLAPELKREYITNLYNGKATPGLMPV